MTPRRLVFGLGPYGLALAAAVVIALIPVMTGDTYNAQLVVTFAIFAILAMSLDFILGYAGHVTMGHPGLFGVGAYVSGVLTTSYSFTFLEAAAVTIPLVALTGLGLGFASLRTSGLYLALVTLGFTSLVLGILYNWSSMTGGDVGLTGIPGLELFGWELDLIDSAVVAVACAFVTFVVLRNIVTSRAGRALGALRQSDAAARALGVDRLRFNLVAFTISSALVGVAGVLYAHTFHYLSPQTFGFALAIEIIVMVVLGGMGTLWGAAIGAAILVLLPEYLKPFNEYEQLPYGLILLFTVLFLPRGLMGLARSIGARVRPRATPTGALLEETRPPDVDDTLSRFDTDPSAAPAPLGDLVLEARGIVLRFGGVVALDDASLGVRGGSVHGLVGPNGSGKTSLLNCISGFYSPQEGRVELLGQPILGLAPETIASRGLVRTFQNLQLFPESSLLENVMVGCHKNFRSGFPAATFRLPRHFRDERAIRERALECLDLVGLRHIAQIEARHLPYGQQKLVDLARGLAATPEVLLLDEPAAGLHHEERARIGEVIRAINRDLGVTLVIVEHHMEMVMDLCHEVTVLDKGRPIAVGAPDEVTSDPAMRRAYLGEEVAFT